MKTSHKIWIGTGAFALAVIGTGATLAAQSRGDVHALLKGVGADSPTETYGSEDLGKKPAELQLAFAGQDNAEKAKTEAMQLGWVQESVQSIVDEVMKTLEDSGALSGKKLTDQQKAELKAKLKARLDKLNRGFEFQFDPKTFKGLNPEDFKSFDNGKGFVWQNNDKMTEEQRKAFEESMKALHESLKNLPKVNNFVMPPMSGDQKMTEEQRKAFEESMKAYAEAMKSMGDSFKEMPKMREFVMPPMKDYKMTDEQRKALEEEMSKMREQMKQFKSEDFKFKMDSLDKQMKGLRINLENIKKFMDSLTPEQKKLADKQGYLKPSDLTKEQRDLLGIGNDDEFKGSMKFNMGDKSFTIRSGDKSGGSSTTRSGVITA